MKYASEYNIPNNLYNAFLNIHSEVMKGKLKYENSVVQNADEILSRESKVFKLKEELQTLKIQNEKDHIDIESVRNNIAAYEKQCIQLENVLKMFLDENKKFNTCNIPTLSDKDKIQVEMKIDDIIDNITQEFNICDFSELDEERKKLHELKTKIEDEISILEQIKNINELKIDDDVEIMIDHYSFFGNENKKELISFKDLNIDDLKTNQPLYENISDTNLEKSKIDLMQSYVQKINNFLSYKDNIEKNIYSYQLEFLLKLKEELDKNELNDDKINSLENEFQKKIKIIQSISNIKPIIVNEKNNFDNEIKPLSLICNQFHQFCNTITNEDISNKLKEIDETCQKTFDLPHFKAPQTPKCIIKSKIDDNLLEQTCHIQNEIKKIEEKKNDIKSDKTELLVSQQFNEPINDICQSKIEVSFLDDFQITKEEEDFNNFINISKSKLPQNLGREIQNLKYDLPFQDSDYENINNIEIEQFDIEANIKQREEALNRILISIGDVKTPSIPNISIPKYIETTVEQKDISPLLSSIKNIVKPNQVYPDLEINEIENQERKLKELQSEIDELKKENKEKQKDHDRYYKEFQGILEEMKSLSKEIEKANQELLS